MGATKWQQCLEMLEGELSPEQINTWIKPLQAIPDKDSKRVRLLAPNKYIRDQVRAKHLERIMKILGQDGVRNVDLVIGSETSLSDDGKTPGNTFAIRERFYPLLDLNKESTFDTFVEGRCNEFARAAARQVAENVGGSSYNPLLLYGGAGLGKTHLMHAIGNFIVDARPELKVAYMYSQRFIEDMVLAIERRTMPDFTNYYRSVDVLLMDDIQFLNKGPKTQEEFFNVFNRLQEKRGQIVLTCDRVPKEIEGLEKRLESRFMWGMTAPVEPPELETRVAILLKKAELEKVRLPSEAAFFIARQVRSNVRELEGTLKRVIANAEFNRRPITVEQVQEALKDLIAIQERQVGVEHIKKIVANYYKIRIGDLHSKKRTRSIARPRQLAMALAKELTNHSLPEIGDSFGGRDHTTVLHACRKVEELRELNREIREDYENLLRLVTV